MRIKKIISIIAIATFISIDFSYGVPSSRSLFRNKRVDYKKLSTESEERLKERKTFSKDRHTEKSKKRKEKKNSVLSSHLKDLSQLHIPPELGRVVEVYDASQEKTEDRGQKTENRLIVHIQDLHTNPEAQLNMASILEILIEDYGLELVCSEGAEGIVDTSSVSSFSDAKVREKTARLFIDSGELTAEEYVSITKYPDLPIWGIEDREIYFKNIRQFNKIMRYNKEAEVFISQIKRLLEGLKPKIYSKRLQEIDKKEEEYEENKIETNEYLDYLLNLAPSSVTGFKNITLLQEIIGLEKRIKQKKVIQESEHLLLNLQSTISKKGLYDIANALSLKAKLFKAGKISAFSFYTYLKGLALENNPGGLKKYSQLDNFITYLTKLNSLDNITLFSEIEELGYRIKDRFAKNEKEKVLTNALRNTKFLKEFFNLEVSNEGLDYYFSNKDTFKVSWFKSAIRHLMGESPSSIDFNPSLIDDHFGEIEEFYDTVKQRDKVMIRNAISEIEKRDSKVTALISGGFHSKGLTETLKEKGYSYIVITPYSSTEIDEENYRFLLSGKRRPISDLIEQLGETRSDKK